MATQTLSTGFNRKSRQGNVLNADRIWAQVGKILADNSQQLPQTPRRPDVRLIINNVSGHFVLFQNPGNHSDGAPEMIPAAGDKTAAMVMVKGATLDEQYKNAKTLYGRYDLGTAGLSDAFVTDLREGKLADLVDEAYGPTPFQAQAGKLADVSWTTQGGVQSQIPPQIGVNAAFGARPPTKESVFLAEFPIRVRGTRTTPELVESAGLDIAVSSDGTRETTRPIVPSVARTYYGENVKDIPEVIVSPGGKVKEVNLKGGAKLVYIPQRNRASIKPSLN